MKKKSLRRLSVLFIAASILLSSFPSLAAENAEQDADVSALTETSDQSSVTPAPTDTAEENTAEPSAEIEDADTDADVPQQDAPAAAPTAGTEQSTEELTETDPETMELMSVKETAQTDREKIEYVKTLLEKLNFKTDGTKKVITSSVNLPSSISTDNGSVDISWTSSDESWLLSDGTLVNQPESGSVTLSLTAVFSSGDVQETVTYDVAVRTPVDAKAFPGAQGYGTQTRGGAGGYVYHVTSLSAADEPGTLRYGLETLEGARTIVFDVGGTIDLTSLGRALRLSGEGDSHVTIAGQTAPGEGIQLKGYGLTVSNVEDVIIRNISIRIGNVRKAGDTYQSDPLSVTGANERVVIDHCTLNWGIDMGFRVSGEEITMSNCMISKGLYWNTPHEKGAHNYAGIFQPKYGTFYGNYIADCGQRAPRISDNEYVDVRNNVVFNSKYTFDLCNYEWMGANTKYNVVNNVVLKGNPTPAGSGSNSTEFGSYKYFQGRTYSGGVFTYTVNNYDNTDGARSLEDEDPSIDGAIWTGNFDWTGNLGSSDDISDDERALKEDLKVISPGGYSNLQQQWRNIIMPDNMSLDEYDASLVSKKGNTLMNYPFAAPDMQTYTSEDAAKYVLSNAGTIAPERDILSRRYFAEGRTRLQILSDYSKVSGKYGIRLPDDFTGSEAYGMPVEVHTEYLDSNGTTVYDVDGNTVSDPENYTVKEQFRFVSCEDHLDSLYATDGTNKYLVVLDDYAQNNGDYDDSEGIYDAFSVYDINNTELERPDDYAHTDTMTWTLNGGEVNLKFADWGDGAGNYDHSDNPDSDGNFGTPSVDTEWNEYDWPQLPETVRDGDFDSNRDGIPDFFVELMGWNKMPGYSPDKDISRLDYEGRGYTNLEYYINDFCASDQELEDGPEAEPVEAENVRDGSSRYDTHNSHEILFNTVRRAKAVVYYNEGSEFDSGGAAEFRLNSVYDVNDSRYGEPEDFETYFSAVLSGLKPDTEYSYRIRTYSDTGVEMMSDETYHFRTKPASEGKPEQPRITKYVPFDEQITLTFEPGSSDKTYSQLGWADDTDSGDERYLTHIGANEYDTKTDHYEIRVSDDPEFTEIVREITYIPSTAGQYVINNSGDIPEDQKLENGEDYYIELVAVSADGTKSDPAVYNQKKLIEREGVFDQNGNPMYEVAGIAVNGSTVTEYPEENDISFTEVAVEPSRYVVNADYARDIAKYDIGEGESSKFITVFGDIEDWYIYTLGGIPIPSSHTLEGDELYGTEHDPILLLRDESHDHGFTYAKKFDTPLSGKSTIHAKIMIRNEELDPMNQAPEFRFYLQQDSAQSDASTADEGEDDVESTDTREATTFGNIVTLQFTKNDIIYNSGSSISRYNANTWYDIKIQLDADLGMCNLYINDQLIGRNLEYSESATSNTVARWQISSRLAGTEDVFVEYMYAYTGWDDPDPDPDSTSEPVPTVRPGSSTSTSGGGGGGGGGGGAVPSATSEPSETPAPSEEPSGTEIPEETQAPSGEQPAFGDMAGYEWAVEAVNALSERGIVSGSGGGHFEPGRDVTRAEFAAMLMRGFGMTDEAAECDYTDVPEDSWYYSAVASASELGVVKGMGDGTFGAQLSISRQDMAVMIVRMLEAVGRDVTKVRDGSGFADSGDIADYAADAVMKLYEAGIIDGVGDNMFDPNGTANRAAAAKVLYGALLTY